MAGFDTECDAPPAFTVYIGGLSYSTPVEGLESFLSENSVTATNVRIVSRDGESKGFGYADFESKEEGEKCIALNGMELDGRTLRCNVADAKPAGGRGGGRGGFGGRGGGGGRGRGRGGGSAGGRQFDNDTPTKLLMVRNLSWNTDNDALYGMFGEAQDARVCRFSDTGKSRGFAFVEFVDVETATKAREEHNGVELDGREITIIFAEPRR
jgi:nucleolin